MSHEPADPSAPLSSMAPYALIDEQSQGRVHADPYAPAVPPFVVDRQRIVHASAFRRLEYKTQVFVNHEGDHFRTRLTHTLEVAHLARRLADALRINAALAEAAALAHDLGHPPFGHAGETALDALLAEVGGFEHNAQAFRVVTELERPYPAFHGLNLTHEVLESLLKHSTVFDRPRHAGLDDAAVAPFVQRGPHPPLEAQAVALADRIAFDLHDLEDALEAGLLRSDQLDRVGLWSQHADPVCAAHPSRPLPAVRRPIIDAIENALLDDAVRATTTLLEQDRLTTPDQIRGHTRRVVHLSSETERALEELETLLRDAVYAHPRLVRMDAKGRRFIERMFEAYVAEPRLLPPRYVRRMDHVGTKRVIADYIAGMTDRFCQDEYKRLFHPFERV